MSVDMVEEELKKASLILDEAFGAIDKILGEVALANKDAFPSNPAMLPVLFVTAICRYIYVYLNSFPVEFQPTLISSITRNLEFVVLKQAEHSLMNMPVAGHA